MHPLIFLVVRLLYLKGIYSCWWYCGYYYVVGGGGVIVIENLDHERSREKMSLVESTQVTIKKIRVGYG